MEVDDGVTRPEPDDAAARQFLRKAWVAAAVEARLEEFADVRDVDVVCATWNANGKDVTKMGVDLEPWLKCREEPADIYAVGAQEMVDLTVTNVVVTEAKSSRRADAWCAMVEAALAKSGRTYEKLASRHLVGCFLAVYAIAEPRTTDGFCAARCRDVDGVCAGVGALGMLGNKGACCVRVRAFDSTLCFVASHLAAHRGRVAERNRDFDAICKRTWFSSAPPRVLDHDAVFWLGDLNYRIRADISTAEVFARAEAGDLAFLRAHDQLNVERAAGRVFRGFDEGPLTFPVTYKYEQGTSRLEQRPDKKLRAPAWCDRVLWRANARSRASLKSYGCAMDVVPSDHKPVFARLSCRVLEVLPAKRRAVEETATARLDAADAGASGAPLLSAESSADLGRVFFDAPSSTTLRLAHAGGGAVHWRVVGRARDGAGQVLGAGRPAPRAWLSLSTNSGTLLPGDVENLEVVIRVDAKTARRLNAGSEVLSDLLAVHVEGGATLFITVRGDWVPSAWGGALGDLCARGADAADPRVGAPIPPELWRLGEALKPHFDYPELFSGASDEAVASVRAAVDAGGGAPDDANPRAVAAALTSLLAALARPVVAPERLPRLGFQDADHLRSWTEAFLTNLPDAEHNVVSYVLALLRTVLKKGDATPAELSAVACAGLMPYSSGALAHMDNVLQYLLTID